MESYFAVDKRAISIRSSMVYPGDSPPIPPMSEKDRFPKTKKKVEWSSTVDSVAPEDRSPNWDSETGN